MLTFTPTPTDPEAPAGGGRLFVRFGLNRGVSVIQKQDGTFYTTRFPDLATLSAAKAYWIGGYTYDVDAATAAALTAAGFTVDGYGSDTYLDNYSDVY